jgi:hypothetical protein
MRTGPTTLAAMIPVVLVELARKCSPPVKPLSNPCPKINHNQTAPR